MLKYLSLVLVLLTLACATPVTIVTPQGKAAYTADEIVLQLEKLQNTTIALETKEVITKADARLVVQFVVSSTKTLKETPEGALPTIKVGLVELNKNVKQPQLNSILDVISAMLEVY